MRIVQLLPAPSAVVPLALLVGCADAEGEPGPHDPAARMHPELLDLSASSVSPGRTVEVRFPEGTDRGVAWALEAQDGDDWRGLYYLTAGINDVSVRSPSWWAEEVGVSGPGLDTLRLPSSIRPGTCRLCTANSIGLICTTLDVAEQE